MKFERAYSSMNMTNQEFLHKLGTKSKVRQYFGLLKGPNVEDGSAYCNLCCRKKLAKSWNTSNLKAHLKNSHKAILLTTETFLPPYLSLKLTHGNGSTDPRCHYDTKAKGSTLSAKMDC